MSKSLGNHIPIITNAEDMYGKLMSIPDSAMPQYFRLVTRWTPGRVAAIEKELQEGSLHPRDAKMALAFEVTDNFFGKQAAEKAQESFVNIFVQGDMPAEISDYKFQDGQNLIDVLVAIGFTQSKSEAKRMIEQKGVRLDGQIISDWDTTAKPGVLQVGKRKFMRLVQ